MKKRKVLSAFLAVAILVSTVCSVSIWLSAANGAGTPPDPAEDYELKESVVMENFLNAPVSNAVATFEGVTVTDIPNVDSAYSYKATMLQDSSTTANQDLRYISSKQKIGLPADKTGLVYKMWVRYTPAAGVSDSVKQTVRFQAPEAIDNNGTAAKGDNLYDDMTVTGNGTWTLVEFPVAEMTGAANFDGCGVWTVTFTSLKGNTFKTGDVIEFANITVVKQQWILKNNGMGAYPGEDYEEGSKVVLSNFLNPPVSNAFATMEYVTVTDIPETESASSYKATILQASSTTTNNDFRYISSTKKYGLTDNHEYLMLTFWARYTPKAGASDEASQTIRAQVREAVSDGSGGYVAGDLIYGDAQIVGNGEWQKVKLPISDMVGGVNFDGTGVWTMTFTSLKGNTFVADDVIEFAAVQFERPKWVRKNDGLGAYPGEDYEAGSKTVLENFLNPPVENAFASAARNDVTDVPNTVLASSYQYTILQPSSTTANNDFRYISSTKKDGLPKETDYLILSFWTRYIPKAGANETAKQTLRVQYREAVANGTSFAAGDLMTGDFTVVGDGTWQKVSMRITDMVGGENFNGCGVWTMIFTSLKGNTFVANDTVEFADIRIEKPVWVLKNNGLGAYPGENYEAGTETVLTDFLNLPAGNAFADMQRVDATDIPNVMLAASYKATLLQNSSATGNNDFRYISTTKKYGLPKETSNLYFTLWVRCVPKTAADPAQKQTIRVTIREAIATGTDTYDGGDTMYGDFVVTCDGSWQQISLPIADMVGGANFDGCGIWTVTFTSLKGNTFKIDDVIEFADIHIEKPVWVLKNGGMGECPGNDYEAGSVSVLQDFLNVPAGNDFASIDRVMAADLPGGTMAYNYRMTLLENYNDTVYNTGNQLWNNTTHNKDFRYISSSKKTGLPADKTGLYVSLWVRYTPKAGTSDSLNQRIRVQIREAIDDGAGAQTSGDLIYGDLVATGNGEWVKVELPIEDMVGAANFDGCGVWTWTFTSLKGNTFSKGDVIEFANVEFRKPAWVLKNDGMGAAPGEDYIIGQKIYWKNEATLISRIVKESLSMKHEIVSIDEAAIDTTKAYKTTFGDAADFNEHKLYYMFYPDAANVNEGIDMSAVMDEARIGFWFKTPEGRDNMSFRLSLFDNKWVGYLNKDFVIVKGGEWTYVEIKFADMIPYREIVADNMGRMEIRLLDTANGLADGESLYITDIRMFTRQWVVKPDLYEDNMSQYDNPYKTESNVVFKHTASDEVVATGPIAAVKKTNDGNGEYSDFSREVTTTIAPEAGDWSVILKGNTVNLLDVYDTAALRLFVKSPKENLRLVVGLVDTAGNKLTTTVMVNKKDVWQEIQIRPSKLKAAGFDRTAIAGVYVGSEYKEVHSDKYLAANQALLISGVEIYDNSPTRKKAETVNKQTIAEAIDSTFLLLPGTYGTGIDIRPDYINLMNDKATWQVYFKRESRKGIALGIPLPEVWDLSDYQDFGYLSFAIAADRYTSLNLEITDGENTYTQEATAGEEWMEYRVYFHDIAAAGVDPAKIEAITLVRNRPLGQGCVINVTEFTAYSDLCDITYTSGTVGGNNEPKPQEPQDNTPITPTGESDHTTMMVVCVIALTIAVLCATQLRKKQRVVKNDRKG